MSVIRKRMRPAGTGRQFEMQTSQAASEVYRKFVFGVSLSAVTLAALVTGGAP